MYLADPDSDEWATPASPESFLSTDEVALTLVFLRVIGEVKTKGKERIGEVELTRYAATADVNKVVSLSDSGGPDVPKAPPPDKLTER